MTHTAVGTKRSSRRGTPLRRILAWVIMLSAVLGWWAFLRPSGLGGPVTFITVSGVSMEPGLHTDDLALMYDRDTYDVGDVVAFRADPVGDGSGKGAFVIHRITGGNGDDGYIVRGDNNDWDDPWTPTDDEIAGEMVFTGPGFGVALRWITKPFHLATLFASVAVALVAAGGDKPSDPRTIGQDARRIEQEVAAL